MSTVEIQPPDEAKPKALDAEAYALETVLKSLIQLGASTSPRSKQTTLGISQAGQPCDRQLAYRANLVTPVKLTDPLASLVGIGFHLAMAELFTRLDAGTGRFLVEQPVSCRGIPGTFDLYDRLLRTLFDWKTTKLAKIKHIRSEGIPAAHMVQLQLYGQALKDAGEDVRWLALAYVPVDSTLDDMYVWRTNPDSAVIEKTTQRLVDISFLAPSEATANPSPLCNWCQHHHPQGTDVDHSCSGK